MASSVQPSGLAAHLSQYLVPNHELQFGEYVFVIPLTDADEQKQKEKTSHFCQITCALLNTSGGVIIVDLGVSTYHKDGDKWKNDLRGRLKFLPEDVYTDCIALHDLNDLIYVVVHKAKEFITSDSFMYTRDPGAASVLVRHHRGISTILSQDVIEGEARIFPLTGPYSYMQSCPMAETQNLEFKCYSCKKVNDLIAKLQDDRVAKTLFAMGNVPGGGEIIIGIKESDPHSSSKQTKGKQTPHNKSELPLLKGQELSASDEHKFITQLENHLQNASGNSKRIWGDPTVVPVKGTHWDCEFIPLGPPPYICQPRCQSCPHGTRRVLICIRILQCEGGLFAKCPESFTLTDDGAIIQVPFEDWKRKHSRPKGKKRPAHTETPVSHLPIRKTIQSPTVVSSTDIAEQTDTFEDGMMISFKEHSTRSEVFRVARDYSDQHKEKTDIFESAAPVHFTPSKEEIGKYLTFKNKKNFPQEIDDELRGQTGFGIADETLFDCIEHSVTAASLTPPSTSQQSASIKPPNHIMDLLVVTDLTRMFLFVICSALGTNNWLIPYTMVLARALKNKLLQHMPSTADYKAMNIMCKIVSLDGSRPHCSPEYYHRWFTNSSSRNLASVRKALASVLAQVKTHFRDAIHLGADMTLSQEQSQVLLSIQTNRFNIVEGPPGCGKTLLARRVCEKHGRETSAYISGCVALNARIGASGEVDVFYAADSSQILSLLRGQLKDKMHVVIDENHNYTYTDEIVHEICRTVAVSGMNLYVFQDSKYQNYKQQVVCQTLQSVMRSEHYGSCSSKTLTEIRRNSQVVGSFLKEQVLSLHKFSDVKCASALTGDDIVTKHIANIRRKSKENGLVKHIDQLIVNPLDSRSARCTLSDIAVLIDHPDNATAMEEVRMYRELFLNVWPDSKPQGAEVYPVEGVIVDTLTNFAGLESKVVVFVMPPSTDTPETVTDTKHRIAVASRGIERVDFVREENLDLKIAENMRCDHYPQGSLKTPNEANKLTRELRVQEQIYSMAVTAAGDILYCSDDSVLMYSADGARFVFYGPLPDPRSPSDPRSQPDTLRPWSVAAHGPSGDVVVGYVTRTKPYAVYLTVFSRASNTWSPPHSLGAGQVPRVAWTQAGRVAVGAWDTLVMYDPTRHTEVWRRTVGDRIHDLAVCGEWICCCHWNTASISVCDQDGALSRTFVPQAPGRQFSRPVSVCEGGGGQLLVLHREEVDGRETGLVTAWTGAGEHARDVVRLPAPSPWDFLRSHGATLCVSVSAERRILCYRLRPESSPAAAAP